MRFIKFGSVIVGALAASAVIVCPSASAKPPTAPLEELGSPPRELQPGDPLVLSSDAVFIVNGGREFTCDSQLEGTLSTNGQTVDGFSITSGSISCSGSPKLTKMSWGSFGPGTLSTNGHPLDKSDIAGASLHAEFESGLSCAWRVPQLKGKFNTGGAITISTENVKFKGGSGNPRCEKTALLSATWALDTISTGDELVPVGLG
jgi:hypothetical protein